MGGKKPKLSKQFIDRVRRERFLDKESGRICGLTPFQLRAAEAFVATGGDKVRAVKMASEGGLTKASAKVRARVVFGNELVQAYVERIIRERDMITGAMDVQDSGLRAKVVHQGVEMDAPDHNVRLKASNNILKLARVLEEKRTGERGRIDGEVVRELMEEPVEILRWAHRKGRMPDEEERMHILATDAEAAEVKQLEEGVPAKGDKDA
jgi:hypothetical protein